MESAIQYNLDASKRKRHDLEKRNIFLLYPTGFSGNLVGVFIHIFYVFFVKIYFIYCSALFFYS